MSFWENIETAPKDGTLIDVWSDRLGRVPDVFWHNDMEKVWAESYGHQWAIVINPKKYLLGFDDRIRGFVSERPTHWMKRPDPPKIS